ncbi:MAG: MotA/TolQ/ExbB proton channel family protein [Burkholderiaceae bacterium]|nr:MotA/TolQ/ExbB proton channel family protein [Burkholderiaceae bacterium]
MTALYSLPLHLLVAGGALAALLLSFLALFLLPGLIHWFRLRRVQREMGRIELRAPPGELRKIFARDRRLAQLWKEFEASLHVQREERDGQPMPVAVRSTLPAETFFNGPCVVDARLRTEFFKHLPGIYTGIGIIGTFTGLIEGLRQFQVSENAATVRSSLESLMHAVGQAFLISASAIAAAIVVTFLEKLLLSALYAATEDIAHAIDARFDAGAGEDYLSRLVQASEGAASQSKALKDALVAEIAGVMREQTDRQISGLANAISASIERSLAAPLQKIASAVQTGTRDQSALTSQLLKDVMGRFGERLNDVLGGQVSNINDLNQQTGQTMQDAVRAVRALVETISETNRHSSDAMAANLTETTRAMLATLADSQRLSVEGQQRRESAMTDRSAAAMDSMAELLARALAEMKGASSQMAVSVDAMTHMTTAAFDRMSSGASQLSTASQSFATAGDRVSGVMEQAAVVSAQTAEASRLMLASAADMRSGLDDYRAHRDAVSHLVTELRTTVEHARTEASLTADVLDRIQLSTERLGQAQEHADLYLNSVSKVLGDAHQAFAIAVKKTLELANTEFHTKLSTAVGLLSSTVVELEATLGNVTPQRH